MRRLLLAFLLLCACGTVFAQTPQVGLYEFGAFDTPGFDTINRGNLNVHLSIPIVSKPGRGGTAFNFTLNYDGLVWTPTSASGTSVWAPAANWGWTTESTAEYGYVSYNVTSMPCPEQYIQTQYTLSGFVYHDQSGKAHPFKFTYSPPCQSQLLPTAGYSFGTLDNSGYQLYLGNRAFTAYTRTGQALLVQAVATFHGSTTGGLNGSGIYTDTNGNQITASSVGVFTDTLGKTALTVSGSAPNPVTYSYTDTTGTARSITVNYTNYSVATHFGVSGVTEYSNTSVPLISSIVYPDSTQYSFTYEATPGGSGTVTGRLASITLPTGGTIAYSYTGGSNGIEADGSPSGITRTTTDGSTSYARSAVSTSGSTTQFTDASGNVTMSNYLESTLGYSYETSRSIYAGAASGTPLQTTTTAYASNSGCTTSSVEAPIACQVSTLTQNGIQVGSDTKLFNSGAVVSDNNGFVTETTAYKSFTGPNSIGFSRVASVTDVSGSTQIAETSYAYDQTTPTATSGLPEHVAVSTSRGNLTTVSPWLNTTNAVFGATTNVYYDTGSLLTSTTPNGTSTYGYDATGSYATALTPPTPSSGVSLASGATSDANTGLPLTGTDPNGAQVQYTSYDSRLRPLEVDSLDSSSNVVGKTIYSYSPNQAGVGIYQNASTHTDTETHYDAYGRADRVAVYNGQSANYWYQQDSCFDANGRLSVKSYPYASTGFNVSKVCSAVDGDTYTYDALGRTKTITHSDGTAINYSYNGRATETIDENGVTRITQVDFLGRPTIVCEVTSSTLPMSGGAPGSCGTDISATGYSTTYSYNLATLTTTINQGGQTRSFQTDSLGRTISVTEPESGTTTYSYAYNSTGLVMTRKRPTANQTNATVLTTTTTQYDALGRVVNISYSDGTSPKRFSYDTSLGWPTLAQANLKGRLAGAVGVVNSAGNATAGTVYSYDSLGRITSMDECLPSACGNTIYDRVLNYSYDWQGNLLTSSDGASTITTYGAYSPAAEVGSITTNLTGIAYPQQSLVSSTVNGPYGPISFYLGNGLSQYNGYTQLGQNHGEWICPGAPSARCTGGLYGFMAQWQGSNVISFNDSLMGNNNVNSYDPLNRLSAVSYNAGATTVSYTYDRWGNRLAQNAQSGPSPSYTFNTANNQITTMSYDALGNVLNDGFHSYLYDAENNVIKVDSGNTAVYTYDAMNRRVRVDQSSGSQEFVFNASGQRVSVWNPATQTEVESQFYWGSKPIAFYTPASGQVYFQHQDWVGTERARTTYNGAIAARFLSLPFGDNFTVAAGTDADVYHFAGLDQDSTSSTSHAQFRQYSSTPGRWMSPDPYHGSYDASNPQSFNRYSYAMNNPGSLFDPSGLIQQQTSCDAEEHDCANGGFGGDGNGGVSAGNSPIFVITVDGGNGTYGYSPGTYNSMMSGGPGGGNIIDGSGNIISANGINVGWIGLEVLNMGSFVSTGPTFSTQSVVIAPNSTNKPPAICGGTFTFAGKEADAVEGGAFGGVITEHDSVSGTSTGTLVEAWGGGEGPLAGGGRVSPFGSTKGGFIGFAGVGLSGAFAGIQVGYVAGGSFGGFYAEGHIGPVAVGSGVYLTTGSCKQGS